MAHNRRSTTAQRLLLWCLCVGSVSALSSSSSRSNDAKAPATLKETVRNEWQNIKARTPVWSAPKLGAIVPREFVTQASDLTNLDRDIVIVTTASLPWMTGTAVNPALRASYLASRGYKRVLLMLPWLSGREEQSNLFGNRYFETQAEQAKFVMDWCAKNGPDEGGLGFEIGWYPARYAGGIGSILSLDEITSHIPSSLSDVVILEEPEHLNWYRNGPRWTSRFRHVVGVAHTNYEAYTSTEISRQNGTVSLDVLAERVFTETVTRAHCDVVLQLSATLRPLPHSRVCNVHGVRETFLSTGDKKSYPPRHDAAPCYFLGKALWAKGYDQLLLLLNTTDDLMEGARRFQEQDTHQEQPLIDCFGNGPDLAAIREKAEALDAPLRFKGAADHANASIFGAYDIFINPSISEVLCTATAEALAMGKRVVISRHPSNEFFYGFERCHTFAPGDGAEFRKELLSALELSAAERTASRQGTSMRGLRPAEREALSWEAATGRLVAASALDTRAAPARLALASLVMHSYHWSMTRSPLALDLWLTLSGAGPHEPWEDQYPAVFKAINASNKRANDLKEAARNIRRTSDLISQRIRNADRRAISLAQYEDKRASQQQETPNTTTTVEVTTKEQAKVPALSFFPVPPKWLSAPKPPKPAPKFSLIRKFARPIERVVEAARRRRPTLPKALVEKTAKATADMRTVAVEKSKIIAWKKKYFEEHADDVKEALLEEENDNDDDGEDAPQPSSSSSSSS